MAHHVAPILKHVLEEHEPAQALEIQRTSQKQVCAVSYDHHPHNSVHEEGGDEHVVNAIYHGLLQMPERRKREVMKSVMEKPKD